MANLTTSIQFTHNQRTFKLTVEETSYSIANNTSDISWTVQISGSSATGANYHDSYVKAWVNDQVVVNLTKTWDAKVFPAADGTKTGTITGILHDSITGQKTINLKIEGYSYTYSTQSKTGTFTLTELPRKSTPTVSSSSVTAGNSVTIYTNRVSGSGFTHDIALYDGGTWVQDIGTGVTESISFTPVLSTFANKIRSGDNKTFTVQCVTKNNGSSIGTASCSLKIVIPNNSTTKPTASLSLSDAGSVPSGWNVFVKGKSQLSITVNGSTYQNSTITSVSCSALGSTRTGTAVPLSYNAGSISSSGSVSATVTDSRGFTSNTVSQSYTVYDYGAPSILSSTSVRRCDSSGNITDNGTNVKIAFYAKVYKVNGNNAKNFRVGFRTLGSTGSFTYKTYSSTSNDSNYWYLNVAETRITDSRWTNFSASTSYEFRFEVWDSFTSSSPITMTQVLSTQFDLINFNKNGQAIAFGKISEATGNTKLFEVGLPGLYNGRSFLSGSKDAGAINANECYDGGIYCIKGGSNCPSAQYGNMLVIPYRKTEGNSTPDFAGQILINNGDDAKPDSMYYRTSTASAWRSWHEVAAKDVDNNFSTNQTINGWLITTGDCKVNGVPYTPNIEGWKLTGNYSVTSNPTSFQTAVFGSYNSYSRLKAVRNGSTEYTPFAGTYAASIAAAVGDTSIMLSARYSSAELKVSGGNGDALKWTKSVAWSDQLPTHGSGNDGHYIRFPNLKYQVCFGEIASDKVSIPANSVSNIKTWSFPIAFSSAPFVCTYIQSGSSSATVGYIQCSAWEITTSNFKFRTFSKDSSARTPGIGYIAFGPYS